MTEWLNNIKRVVLIHIYTCREQIFPLFTISSGLKIVKCINLQPLVGIQCFKNCLICIFLIFDDWAFFFFSPCGIIFFFFICGGFCHTLKWNSHGFTCVSHPDPPSHLPLHPLPLGFPSAPGPSACLISAHVLTTELYTQDVPCLHCLPKHFMNSGTMSLIHHWSLRPTRGVGKGVQGPP